MTRFKAQTQNSSQMGPMPNTVARTKLGVYMVSKEKDDPIFSMSCMLQFLHHDLVLQENQIPWFALDILFNKTKGPSETKSLIELALHFLGNVFSSDSLPLERIPNLFEHQKIKHILDLLRLSLVLPSKEVKNYEGN